MKHKHKLKDVRSKNLFMAMMMMLTPHISEKQLPGQHNDAFTIPQSASQLACLHLQVQAIIQLVPREIVSLIQLFLWSLNSNLMNCATYYMRRK